MLKIILDQVTELDGKINYLKQVYFEGFFFTSWLNKFLAQEEKMQHVNKTQTFQAKR
jgi:hypothetical protein